MASPDTLTYAAVDFERETLAEGLRRSGVRLDVPTVCAWLGMTMYLSADAVAATFAERAAAVGEPWRTYFTPAALGELLRDAGFTTVECLTPPVAAACFGY